MASPSHPQRKTPFVATYKLDAQGRIRVKRKEWPRLHFFADHPEKGQDLGFILGQLGQLLVLRHSHPLLSTTPPEDINEQLTPEDDASEAAQIARFYGGIRQTKVQVESSGNSFRITVPSEFRDMLGLGRGDFVVVHSWGDLFEIWPVAAWVEQMKAARAQFMDSEE